MMTRAEYDALRQAVQDFDLQSDNPALLLIGTGLDVVQIALELLAVVDDARMQVAA